MKSFVTAFVIMLACVIAGVILYQKNIIPHFTEEKPQTENKLQKGTIKTDISQNVQCEIEYITVSVQKINAEDTQDLIKVLTKEQIIKQGGTSEKDVVAISDSVKKRFKDICQEQILALSIVFKENSEKEEKAQIISQPQTNTEANKTMPDSLKNVKN